MNIHVVEEEWSYSCGEPGCCDDYGTALVVYRDKEELLYVKYGDVSAVDLCELITKLGFVCIRSYVNEVLTMDGDV